MILDFHTHTFPKKMADRTLAALGKAAHFDPFTNGTEEGLLSSMAKAAVAYSVTLPVMTNPSQVEKLNSISIANREQAFLQGLILFGGIHPDYPDYKRELKRLKENGILGIKIHPAYQATDFDDLKYMRILDAASELGLITLTHAGMDAGIPGHNYASVPQILHVIEEVRPEKLVLGHMGAWGCWKDVEQYLTGAPVYFDTAHSLIPVKYHPDWAANPQYKDNLSDEDFIRIIRKQGTDKILFATDSPWQSQSEVIDVINSMPLTAKEKEDIFGKNAARLLQL